MTLAILALFTTPQWWGAYGINVFTIIAGQQAATFQKCLQEYAFLPQLKLEESWRSKHQRLDSDISLVTQSSLDR